MPESASARAIRFGPFEVNRHAGELRRHGIRIKLSGQPFEVLTLLLERPGEVVTYEELRAKLWQADTFVDFEHGLHAAVNKLRQALGDSAEHPRYVENLARRGYRFVAAVRWAGEAPEAPSVAPAEKQTAPEQMAASASVAQRRGALGRQGATLLGIATVLVALGVGYFSLRNWRASPFAESRVQSLAVLPLVNLSRDPEQEYFVDGMTDELITDLAKIGALRVISRTSAMRYKGTKKSLPEIARELNVDAVVEGTVSRSPGRVHITAQLLLARPEKHLWAESYDRPLGDAVILQGELARVIAREIKVKVTPQEQVRLASARAVNPEAFHLYLQGRYYWNRRSDEAVKKAVEYMNQAIAKDTNYALAYAGLADCYVVLGDRRVIPGEAAYTKGVAAAQRALELDATLAEAHAALASFRENKFDWAGAEAEFKRAIELNPNYATAHQWYGLLLRDVGRFEEARQQIEIARGLDPLSLQIQINVGQLYQNMHQFDPAIEEYRKIVEMDPNFAFTHFVLAGVYESKRMYREAAAEWERFLLLGNEREMAALYEGVTDQAGYRRAVSRRIALLKERAKTRYVSPMTMADLYLLLGDKEQAVAWLEKAYQEHATGLRYLKTEPTYDPLHSDPRFADLLRRMGFPP